MGSCTSKQYQHRASPPPYTETIPTSTDQKCVKNSRTISSPPIKASDAPQWAWSNSECREWLYAILTAQCAWDDESAAQAVSKFRGFGPTLFLCSYKGLQDWLGTVEGTAVYCLILDGYRKKGGVPNTMKMPSKEPKK